MVKHELRARVKAPCPAQAGNNNAPCTEDLLNPVYQFVISLASKQALQVIYSTMFIETKEGQTHATCEEQLKKYGGKAKCCLCNVHDGCSIANSKGMFSPHDMTKAIKHAGKYMKNEQDKVLKKPKKTKFTNELCDGDCPLCDPDKYYAQVNLYDLEVWQGMVQTLAESRPDNKVYWNEWLKTIKRYKQEIHEMFKSLRSK